jgi:hypothetical protein
VTDIERILQRSRTATDTTCFFRCVMRVLCTEQVMLLDALAVIDSGECRASTLVNGGWSRRVGLPDDHPEHGNRCGNVTWTAVAHGLL